MYRDVYIMQLGGVSWEEQLSLPEGVHWFFLHEQDLNTVPDLLKKLKRKTFDVILLEEMSKALSLKEIAKFILPYTVLYDHTNQIEDPQAALFLQQICAQPFDFSDRQQIVYHFTKGIFRGQYGDKMKPIDMVVNPNFEGSIQYNGFQNIELEGDFGKDFRPLLTWKYNKPVSKLNPVEFWLEYAKEGDCELRLRFYNIPEGSTSDILNEKVVEGADLDEAILIDNDFGAYIAIMVEAKGHGRVQIGSLHGRLTRYDFGKLSMGGKIFADRKRQEVIYYFHPGDFKPPLNVYFSGFRRAEGFEGFGIMRSLGAPFLLFQDPRIDGGAFYLGTEEFEQGIKNIIKEHLDLLGFTDRQLNLSGISMGTFGAMYYGADFNPNAIIVSKPLANLGNIAKDAKLSTPGVFPTSFDILKAHTGGNGEREIEQLNQHFWKKFRAANFKDTTFALVYMMNEDYDQTAFKDLLECLYYSDSKVISKGIPGRHNDDNDGTLSWFMNQYKDIMQKDFGRELKW